jgi:hypothetical protein
MAAANISSNSDFDDSYIDPDYEYSVNNQASSFNFDGLLNATPSTTVPSITISRSRRRQGSNDHNEDAVKDGILSMEVELATIQMCINLEAYSK